MTIVPVTTADLDAAEVSWFSALCSDDYQFLGVPDGALRSSWDHCSEIVKEAEAQGFRNVLCPSSYQVGQDTLSFVAGCAPVTDRINLLAAVALRGNAAHHAGPDNRHAGPHAKGSPNGKHHFLGLSGGKGRKRLSLSAKP